MKISNLVFKNKNQKIKYSYLDIEVKNFIEYEDGVKIITMDNSYNELFFNLEGNIHNSNGIAALCCNKMHKHFYLNGCILTHKINEWAFKTNHLLCKICRNFCNQGCF